jgi:hypothetical protein
VFAQGENKMAIFGFVIAIIIGVLLMRMAIDSIKMMAFVYGMTGKLAWNLVAEVLILFAIVISIFIMAITHAPFDITWHAK